VIELSNVSYSYPRSDGRPPALYSINLSIPQGEFLAILGHNGSGKSTLARLLNGLLLPTSGRVMVDGLDTRDPAALWEVRRRLGMVFQNPDSQIVGVRAEEDVAFGPENLGLAREEIRRRVDAALSLVGMEEYAAVEPHHLSGGQKQRVAIAGVLACDPLHLVLDEATALLDPTGRRGILEILTRLHAEGRTVILITHNIEEALDADRLLILREGHLAAEGPPQDLLFRGDLLRELGIQVPPEVSPAAR